MQEKDQVVPDSHPTSQLEVCFNVLFLVLLTGAFMNLFITPEQILDPGAGMPGARIMWAVIYSVVLTYWLRHCKGSLNLLLNERPIVLLVVLAITSVVWSDSPQTTFRRSLALVGTCLLALYFATRFKIREQLRLLAWAFGICTVFSFVFGAFHWGNSADNLKGAWYGIYTQRNVLGSMMVMGELVFLVWARIQPKARWMTWMLAAASFILIMLSGSVTSLIVFSVLLGSFAMVRLLRQTERAGLVLLLLVVLVFGLAWWTGASWDAAVEAVGRDPSLTGRTELWAASALIGLDRPLLGYGYNGFWLGTEGQSADVWNAVGWAAPSAHNGLLEIWLDLGTVGVAIAVFSLGICLRKSLRLVRATLGWEYAWPLLFLIVLIVLNSTESAFFEGNSIYWFLYMVVAMDLSRLKPIQNGGQKGLVVH